MTGRMRLDAVARYRHRGGGAAMIGAGESDDARASRRRGHRAEHRFIGIRARMAEPDLGVGTPWRGREQPFGQFDRWQIGG